MRAAGHVALEGQIVAGGEDGCVARHLGVDGRSEDPDLEARLRHGLAEKLAAQRFLAVVDGDQHVARDQRRAQSLLHFLLGLALRDHRRWAAGGDQAREVDQHGLARARRRRVEAVQRRSGQRAAYQRGQHGRERDGAISLPTRRGRWRSAP